jgi:uncharacterized RDD family membrane protein YckC/predicted Ser/Thr protein kinase
MIVSAREAAAARGHGPSVPAGPAPAPSEDDALASTLPPTGGLPGGIAPPARVVRTSSSELSSQGVTGPPGVHPADDTLGRTPRSSPIMADGPTVRAGSAAVRAAQVRTASTPSGQAAALEAASSLEPGHRLGHFEIIKLIGKGGMGAVYLARDLSLVRDVALKVIATGVLGPEDDLAERFVREARAQANLSHPNVVQIYFIGEDEDLRYFAMEYVEGSTLEDLLRHADAGCIPWRDALEAILSAARALGAAHARGVIHRDIKPSNFLLAQDCKTSEVKVADFGLAKSIKTADPGSERELTLTAKGVILGTPRYMSPEQGLGEPTDHRSDIYALGATAYHLLAGKPPFEAQTPMGLVAKHITAPLPPLGSCRHDIPPGLCEVVHRMMAKKPEDRYQSYDELIAALEGARAMALAPAGFWLRAVATLIDMSIFIGAGWALSMWLVALYPIYYVVMHRIWGQSIGKKLLGLRLGTTDGKKVRTGRLLLRMMVGLWAIVLSGWLAVHFSGKVEHLLHEVWRIQIDGYTRAIEYGASKAFGARYRLQFYKLGYKNLPLLFHTFWPALIFDLIGAAGLGVALFDRHRRALHDIVAHTQVAREAETFPGAG